MRQLFCALCLFLMFACKENKDIIGVYRSVEDLSIIESIEFDETVATFDGSFGKFLPVAKYEVKNNKIYIDSPDGIVVFEIIDANTIECKTSIFKGDRFKK